jgi:PIN domain nuclease of toxin-antitoxin system
MFEWHVRILLDTHLVLWAMAAPSKLPVAARRAIDGGDVFVSAASIWEISIKVALGKLVAQAMHEPMQLLTNDAVLGAYGDLIRVV